MLSCGKMSNRLERLEYLNSKAIGMSNAMHQPRDEIMAALTTNLLSEKVGVPSSNVSTVTRILPLLFVRLPHCASFAEE
jgi:hypothetical protein